MDNEDDFRNTHSAMSGSPINITNRSNQLTSPQSHQAELSTHETPEQNMQNRASFLAPSHRSSTSLADSYSCRLSQHQYHYIQYPYPAAYYEHINQQMQVSSAQEPCRCRCSCGGGGVVGVGVGIGVVEGQQSQSQQQPYKIPTTCHSHQGSVDSQMSVAVIVHRQAGSVGGGGVSSGPAKAQSEQSLLNHSYQALLEEKPLNNLGNSKLNVSCDCDLECTCGMSGAVRISQKNAAEMANVMLGADEITVSESDNNSTMLKKKKTAGSSKKLKNIWCTHDSTRLQDKQCSPDCNSSHIDIYSDGDEDGIDDVCCKDNNSPNAASNSDVRPPLPPRLPPRPRNAAVTLNGARHHGTGVKKYVVWCLLCGGFSCLLGVLFLGVYFLLHSYTITVGNFETVPTFVPAALLILTGLCIMSLARRKNRYSYLIKLSGACGLISALTCALVTVTTTVLHMSRLQALRECEYAQKTRTCTCYSEDTTETQLDRGDKEGVRLVFDSLSDCSVVHGSLYSCLRAIFGLSVAGVLIAVFSCMLVYQLLSHERKKMYWEQLELRCRSLYTSQQGPPPNVAAFSAAARGVGANVCRCCEQCHAHRQAPVVYPWVADDGSGEQRFWTGQPPGNFYSPNPGSEEVHLGTLTSCRDSAVVLGSGSGSGHSASNTNRNRATSGWSWPRMPWQRSSPNSSSRFRQMRQTPSSPDSQYGFSNSTAPMASMTENALGAQDSAAAAAAHNMQPFNIVATAGVGGYGVWGPPPPYSDPNSPARYYQFMQPNACNNNNHNANNTSNTERPVPLNMPHMTEQHISSACISHHRAAFLDGQTGNNTCFNTQQPTASGRGSAKRQNASICKLKSNGSGCNGGEYENAPSDSDCGGGGSNGARDRCSNTLPTRKLKKRVEAGAGVKSIGPNSQSTQRVNVQQVFANATNPCGNESDAATTGPNIESQLNSILNSDALNDNKIQPAACNQSTRHKHGVENTAFQNSAESGDGSTEAPVDGCDPTESEVYFADVSSCCNMSVKNDNYYEDANNVHTHRQHQSHQHRHQNSNCSHSSSCQEDYLAQRFGQRENSVRSRLPFPQTITRTEEYEQEVEQQELNANPANNNMQKDISRQSLCSVESDAKTDFTDLSPSTPSSNKFSQTHFTNQNAAQNFVASFPSYSSEKHCLEAHRRTTKTLNDILQGGSNEAHYEIINDNNPNPTPVFSILPSHVRNAGIKANNQRSNNFPANKRNDLTPLKTKGKSLPREEVDVANSASQSDASSAAWSECGGAKDRMRL